MFKNKFVLGCLFLLSTFQVVSLDVLAMEVDQAEKQRQNALSMNVTKTLVGNADIQELTSILKEIPVRYSASGSVIATDVMNAIFQTDGVQNLSRTAKFAHVMLDMGLRTQLKEAVKDSAVGMQNFDLIVHCWQSRAEQYGHFYICLSKTELTYKLKSVGLQRGKVDLVLRNYINEYSFSLDELKNKIGEFGFKLLPLSKAKRKIDILWEKEYNPNDDILKRDEGENILIDAERVLTIGELKREIDIEIDKLNVLNERLSDDAFASIRSNLMMNKDEVLSRIKRLKALKKERLDDGDIEVETLESSINSTNLKRSGEKKRVSIIIDKY